MDEMRRIKMRDRSILFLIGIGIALLGFVLFVWAMFIAPYQVDNNVTLFVISGVVFFVVGCITILIGAFADNND